MDLEDEIAQRRKARLELSGVFDAADVESILQTIMEARASLLPAVPMEPPSELSVGNVLVQDGALFAIRTLADGGLRIWLRNEGVGWLAFTLSPASRKELADFLSKKPGHTLTTH